MIFQTVFRYTQTRNPDKVDAPKFVHSWARPRRRDRMQWDNANAGSIVARIECVPSAAEIYFDPRGKIIRWVSRDSPDEPRLGVNICAFPAFPQDRRAVSTVTSALGSSDGVRGADLAIFLGIWAHFGPLVAVERRTIERLTRARVVAAAAVLR